MKEFNKKLSNRSTQNQPRIRNSSPYYKNQQAQRFGISGAKTITSQKEKNMAKRIKETPTGEILEEHHKNYRDNQRNQSASLGGGVTAGYESNK